MISFFVYLFICRWNRWIWVEMLMYTAKMCKVISKQCEATIKISIMYMMKFLNSQKQSLGGLQQIYSRTPIPKFLFNKFALQFIQIILQHWCPLFNTLEGCFWIAYVQTVIAHHYKRQTLQFIKFIKNYLIALPFYIFLSSCFMYFCLYCTNIKYAVLKCYQ